MLQQGDPFPEMGTKAEEYIYWWMFGTGAGVTEEDNRFSWKHV